MALACKGLYAAPVKAEGLTPSEVEEAWREAGVPVPSQHQLQPRRLWGDRGRQRYW